VIRLRPSGLVALALLAAARPALAAPVPAPAPLPVTLTARGGRVAAAIDLSSAFPPAIERDLGNGLTNVVAIYVMPVPDDGGQPTAVYGRVIELLFDVWEETYAVTVKDPKRPEGAHIILRNFAALRRFLSEGRDVDLGPVSALPSGPFHVEARVELNPFSKEQLQRTREYIANPAAGTRVAGGTRSVLGAMASFLLREPDAGSDVHLLRSRTFHAGEVAVR
jgi:hypothetical protein